MYRAIVSIATFFGSDQAGRSSRANAGIRQFSFSERGISGAGSAWRALHSIHPEAVITTTAIIAPRTTISSVTLTLVKTVEMTRTNESRRRALTMTVANTFSQGLFTHGPNATLSLHSRGTNTGRLVIRIS